MIDTIANGLKFALNTNGTEYEKIKARDENNQNKELRIQELYRKVYEEDTRNHGQKYSNKTNFDNDNHKSIRSVIFLLRYFILSICELNRLVTYEDMICIKNAFISIFMLILMGRKD